MINFKEHKGEMTLATLFAFTVIATVVGTINVFMGLKWNIATVAIICILSIYTGYKVKHIFYFEKKQHKMVALGITIILFGIYMQYSPVLEVRQDPAVYMLKTMNLINYGTTYSPAEGLNELNEVGIVNKEDYEGYAKLLNGTKYLDENIETDFYAGPVFINATLGAISKDLSFYGATLIAILTGILIFVILINNSFFSKHSVLAGVLSIVYMFSPINTWFFRGTYSEPISCMLFLLLFYTFLKSKEINMTNFVWIILMAVAAYFVRLDFIIIILVCIFILAYTNFKYGIISLIVGCLANLLAKNTYTIYYDRISINDFKVIQLATILCVLAFICGTFFRYLYTKKDISIDSIISRKFFKNILIGLTIILVLFSFRNIFITEPYLEEVFMDGRIMKSYNEQIFNRFYMVFPSIVIMLGVLNLPSFLLSDNFKTNVKIYVLATFIPYCYYLYQSGNSPQLYFNMRRYIYIILPVIFLSFSYVIIYLNEKTAKLVVLAVALLMIDTQLESKQIIEFKGLDTSVKRFEQEYCKEDTIFLYDSNLRYDLSSVISYVKNEFVEISDWGKVNEIKEYFKDRNIYYISQSNIGNLGQQFDVKYIRLGENYDELPKDKQEKSLPMYVIPAEEITESALKNVYPNNNNIFGIYEDGWTSGLAEIEIHSDINTKHNYLVIERQGYSNPLLENGNLGLSIKINDEIELDYEYRENKYYIEISEEIKEIERITITSNVFTPKEWEIGEDLRELGLDIKSIYFED